MPLYHNKIENASRSAKLFGRSFCVQGKKEVKSVWISRRSAPHTPAHHACPRCSAHPGYAAPPAPLPHRCGVMGWIRTTKDRQRERRYEVEDRQEEQKHLESQVCVEMDVEKGDGYGD